MNGKFILEIDLGNDMMRTRLHVGSKLKEVVGDVLTKGKTEGKIRDANGNTVGKWEFQKE